VRRGWPASCTVRRHADPHSSRDPTVLIGVEHLLIAWALVGAGLGVLSRIP